QAAELPVDFDESTVDRSMRDADRFLVEGRAQLRRALQRRRPRLASLIDQRAEAEAAQRDQHRQDRRGAVVDPLARFKGGKSVPDGHAYGDDQRIISRRAVADEAGNAFLLARAFKSAPR